MGDKRLGFRVREPVAPASTSSSGGPTTTSNEPGANQA
jgi:hypothetical protein